MKGLFVKDIELMKQQKLVFYPGCCNGSHPESGRKRECQFCYRIFTIVTANFCHYDYKL